MEIDMTDEIIKILKRNDEKTLNEIINKLTLYWMRNNAGFLYSFNKNHFLSNDFKVYYFDPTKIFENINFITKNKYYAFFYVNYMFQREYDCAVTCFYHLKKRDQNLIKSYLKKYDIGNFSIFQRYGIRNKELREYYYEKKYVKNNNTYIQHTFNLWRPKYRCESYKFYYLEYYTFYYGLKTYDIFPMKKCIYNKKLKILLILKKRIIKYKL